MATRKPLVRVGGKIVQLPSGDTIPGAGGGTFTEASTAPGSPSIGDRWLDTTSGIEYTWISPGAWVDLATAGIDFDDLVQTTGDQSIAGVKTFTDSPIVPAPTTDMQPATKLYVDGKASDAAPPGKIGFFGQDAAPDGWLKANGAAVSRATYAALFTAIGTNFGSGDGSTTFTLPDLRGEFPRGWDDGRGIDSGRAIGTAQLDQMQRITGSLNVPRTNLVSAAGALADSSNTGSTSPASASGSSGSIVFDSGDSPDARVSATTAGETRPRNIALLACIKF